MDIQLHSIKVRDLIDGYVNDPDHGVRGYGGRLDIRPPYQREFRYDVKQKQAVVNTILKGFPLNLHSPTRYLSDFSETASKSISVSLVSVISFRRTVVLPHQRPIRLYLNGSLFSFCISLIYSLHTSSKPKAANSWICGFMAYSNTPSTSPPSSSEILVNTNAYQKRKKLSVRRYNPRLLLARCKKSSKTYNYSPENIQAVRHKVYKANA